MLSLFCSQGPGRKNKKKRGDDGEDGEGEGAPPPGDDGCDAMLNPLAEDDPDGVPILVQLLH